MNDISNLSRFLRQPRLPPAYASLIRDCYLPLADKLAGTLHGFRCYKLQDEQGNPLPVCSIASGVDFPIQQRTGPGKRSTLLLPQSHNAPST